MNYFTDHFDIIIRSNINLNNYFESLYYLIYYRFNCKLDNSSNIQLIVKNALNMLNIKKDNPLYKTITDLIHYEIRIALPIKYIDSYKETNLINALNRCIERYLSYDKSLIKFIRLAFNKEFSTKLIYNL